jgi:5-hydroxyisourate hydrolase-like protein (transthyretin family)
MIRVACFVVGFALTALSQAPNAADAAGTKFQIEGAVVNAVSGAPLSQVGVSIGPTEKQGNVQRFTTNSDGRFQFENLQRGKYWLEAQRQGFFQQRFEQHEEFATAIAVGPGLKSEDLVFRLSPDSVISGSIFDENDDPVRSATVFLFRTGLHDGVDSTEMVRQAVPMTAVNTVSVTCRRAPSSSRFPRSRGTPHSIMVEMSSS